MVGAGVQRVWRGRGGARAWASHCLAAAGRHGNRLQPSPDIDLCEESPTSRFSTEKENVWPKNLGPFERMVLFFPGYLIYHRALTFFEDEVLVVGF